MVDTLLNMSCENIRHNWTGKMNKDDPYYEIVWLNWYKKFNINEDNNEMEKLKKFIESNEKSLRICSLSSGKETNIGDLCIKIGLHHTIKKGILNISKPRKWIWDFTEPMRTIRINEENRKIELERRRKIEREKRELCCKCKSKIDIHTCENCVETYCQNCKFRKS